MNSNLFDNLQALNLLYNFHPLLQNQLLQSKRALLPLNLTQNLPSFLPRVNPQMPVDLAAFAKSIEIAKQQEQLLYQAYHNSLQADLYQAQLLKQKQFESLSPKVVKTQVVKIASPETNIKVSEPTKPTAKPTVNFESNVKQIVDFFVNNFGRTSQKELTRERQRYEHDESLLQVFDTLVSKYASTTKTKEEMVKYVLRKALKSIKDKIKEGTKRTEKEVNKIFYQKYFSAPGEAGQGTNADNEEEMLKLLLPFKKTSQDKTMNSAFLAKIFASEEFCSDYNEYLSGFDTEADFDNSAKMKRFVSYIVTCSKSRKTANILNYKRVPWLKTWLTNTKNIGVQLMKEKKVQKNKKTKLEFNESTIETSDSDCKVESVSTPQSS